MAQPTRALGSHTPRDANRARLHLVPSEIPGREPATTTSPARTVTALRAVLLVAGWVALAVQWVPGLGFVRLILVFGFVLIVPGAAVVMRMPLVNRAEQAALAIGISAAVAIPVSEAFAFAHAWSAKAVLATLAVFATTIVVARRPRPAMRHQEWRPLHGPYPLPTRLSTSTPSPLRRTS